MNILPTIAKPIGTITGGSGAYLVVTSMGEHMDLVLVALGVALVVIGYWLRDWKRRVEDDKKALQAEIVNMRTEIKALQAVVGRLDTQNGFLMKAIEALEGHMEDEWRFQRFAVEGFRQLIPAHRLPDYEIPQRRTIRDPGDPVDAEVVPTNDDEDTPSQA